MLSVIRTEGWRSEKEGEQSREKGETDENGRTWWLVLQVSVLHWV